MLRCFVLAASCCVAAGMSCSPAAATVTAISAGTAHTCAITTAARAVCWGNDQTGQSTPPAGLGPISAITAGETHSCAIRKVGATAVCWGSGGAYSPPAGLGPITAISAGGFHTCAITTDATAVCWGADDHGESTPPAGLGTIKAISAGDRHTCAIRTDSTVACWGDDLLGQSDPPAGLGVVSEIDGGYSNTCAIKADDSAACWGFGSDQIAPPTGLGPLASISAGGFYACAVDLRPATLACWGVNALHQSERPAGLGAITAITTGYAHTCALRRDATVLCWGDRTYDQLGEAPRLAGYGAPDGRVGAYYSSALKAYGRLRDPLSFSIKARGRPPGLSISKAGVLHGTPTRGGWYTVPVRIDNGPFSTDETVVVPITPPMPGCAGVRLTELAETAAGVRVGGFAWRRYAGSAATITRGGRRVATARIAADGSFGATLPGGADAGAYGASVAGHTAQPRRPERLLVVTRRIERRAGVRLIGRLHGPDAAQRRLHVDREQGCTWNGRGRDISTDRKGRFFVTLPKPAADSYEVYRIRTATGAQRYSLEIVLD